MKLSHTTKVTVRKALAALRTLDNRPLPPEGLPATHRTDGGKYIAEKAGFRDRAVLEQFARKHHLL